MKFIKLLTFLVFTFLYNASYSVNDTLTKNYNINKSNIEKIDCIIALRPYYVYQPLELIIFNRDNSGKKITYKPVIPGILGFNFSFKFVKMSFSFKLPQSSINRRKYGNTDYKNFSVNIQSKKLLYSAYYLEYKGFYLNKPNEFDSLWNFKMPYPQRSDIDYLTVGISTQYIFSDNFSMNAAFDQGERLTKSGGSFMVLVGERYSKLTANSSLIPASQANYYYNVNFFRKGKINSINIAPGYGYSLVKDKFSFNNVLLLGSTLQVQSYETSTKRRTTVTAPYYVNFKSSLVYDQNDIFASLEFSYELNSIPINNSTIRVKYPTLEAGVGFRIFNKNK